VDLRRHLEPAPARRRHREAVQQMGSALSVISAHRQMHVV
jgi:hypothetical protein